MKVSANTFAPQSCNACISAGRICIRPDCIELESDIKRVLAAESYFLIAGHQEGWQRELWKTLADLIGESRLRYTFIFRCGKTGSSFHTLDPATGKLTHSNSETAEARTVESFLLALKVTGDRPPHLLSTLKTTHSQNIKEYASKLESYLIQHRGLKRKRE
jgi:hypothetical protein